jgi:hypothetical protein
LGRYGSVKSGSGTLPAGTLALREDTRVIGGNAFLACDGLTGNLTINNVVYIGNNAFSDCPGLNGTLTIGTSVTDIGPSAFSSCSFTNVVNNSSSFTLATNTGPASKILLKASTNGDYNYSKTFDEQNVGRIAYGTLKIPDNVTSIVDSGFANLDSLTGLIIGSGVTSIGDSAFVRCRDLTGSLTIPNNVTSIGKYAFVSCTSLSNLTLGTKVSTIEKDAFEECSSLSGVLTIPDSVTSIGEYAFNSCSSFTSIVGNFNGAPSVGSYAFYG